jgi:ribose-phosphate pyrophosphokinase
MSFLIFPLPGNEDLASQLAAASGGTMGRLETRHFPDGETYVRFADSLDGQSVVIACTLDRPDAKIAGLLFAADAARELGAKRVGLAAPYLCYMRQDKRFRPGEAVTSRSFATLISQHFDWLVTIDPHLHRYRALDEIYSIPALALHAGAVIADWIGRNIAKPYLIGPDSESSQWIEAVAAACGAPWAVLTKTRTGDISVSETPLSVPLAGRSPILLDDIISSGSTLLEALRQLPLDADPAVLIAIHDLCSKDARQSLVKNGVRLITTNSVPNADAQIDIVPLLAGGVRQFT